MPMRTNPTQWGVQITYPDGWQVVVDEAETESLARTLLVRWQKRIDKPVITGSSLVGAKAELVNRTWEVVT
jgi:hypothetical protein